MTSPYGDEQLCRSLSDAELEATFFYPAAENPAHKPGRLPQAAWDRAKELCIQCPVFLRCREASWGETHGVWGGTDQYERYLYRRRRMREVARMDARQREALAQAVHARHAGFRGMPPHEIARRTGYSLGMVNTLIAEHRDAMEAAAQAARDAVGAPALLTERRAA